MSTRQVPVSDLQFGMYIAELDRPWTQTPFMFQGFYLRTGQQLQALRKLCRHVFVDVERADAAALGQAASPRGALPLASPAPGFAIQGSAEYPEQAAFEEELARCSPLYLRSVRALLALYRPLEEGSAHVDGREVRDAVVQLAQSVVRNPDALLLLSKMRGGGAAAHARALQVCVYMMVFARFLQLEREEIELLGLLGLLQDIGKTRLPAALLAKPGALSAAESEIAKKHVELSAHLLGAARNLPPRLAALALLHHERQDGSGYPRGLKAYQIGLYGWMAAICDTYDALMAVRPYAGERSPSAAAKLLLMARGSAFHAGLVDAFMQCLGAFPVGSLVELDCGEIAIVIGENRTQRLKPKVMIVLDGEGRALPQGKAIDLSKEELRGAAKPPYRVRRTLLHSALDIDLHKCFRLP